MSGYRTLCLNAPDAREVLVAGTFNGWQPAPMRRTKDGDWTIDVWLPPGRHEFKFLVDGHWCCDVGPNGPLETADGCVHNAFGTMNRVLDVPSSVPPATPEHATPAPGARGTQQMPGAEATASHTSGETPELRARSARSQRHKPCS